MHIHQAVWFANVLMLINLSTTREKNIVQSQFFLFNSPIFVR